MKVLFIAPIDIKADASAGAETINLYINQLSNDENEIVVLAKTKGRYSKNNIKYCKLHDNLSIHNFWGKIYKTFGWIIYPQNRFLYKTTQQQRNDIFNQLKFIKEEGFFPDVIILETTTTILLVDEISAIFPDTVTVASLHDIAYQGSERRMLLERNWMKLIIRKRYLKWAKQREIQALSKVDIIAPHNSGNVNILKSIDLLNNRTMIPLIPFYSTGYNHNDNTARKDILFYGLMNRHENYTAAEWFIEKVVPFLPENYRFIVMGGKPTESLKNKASDKVCITGFVSEREVKEYFEQSFCIVIPLLFGSGIKTKVLTALSSGLPVLSNYIGIEGIDAKSDSEYLYCETPEEFIANIERIDKDKKLYSSLCINSREFMKKSYDMEKGARKFNDCLKKIIAAKRTKIDPEL